MIYNFLLFNFSVFFYLFSVFFWSVLVCFGLSWSFLVNFVRIIDF
jgi:hypothetical protein